MRKIGIFGGTFDPVHIGHMGLAEDAVAQVGLDEVIMIPAKIQPFKQEKKTESGEDRFQMLALVASLNDQITVSRDELDNEGVSYSYLTLRRMQEKNPDAQLYFICGSDSFLKVDTWMNAEEILEKYSFIVAGDRPGYKHEELESAIKRIQDRFNTEIIIINNRQFDVSSTVIRDRLAQGKSIEDLVPAPVERYIIQHGLYRL